MAVRIKRSSRLNFQILRQINGIELWERRPLPIFTERDDDNVISVESANTRLDLIANEVYGDVNMMWVIMAANGIRLWTRDLQPGTELRLPSEQSVASIVGRPVVRNR